MKKEETNPLLGLSWVARARDQWQSVSGLSETTLLRLVVLRALQHKVHSKRTSVLAEGSQDQNPVNWNTLETRIQEYHGCDLARMDFETVLTVDAPDSAGERFSPKQCYSIVPKEKLNRHDRLWEKEMVGESLRLGWEFSSLECWIETHKADVFHQSLENAFWPQGVLLTVESLETADSLWKGCWKVAHPPSTKTGSFDIESLSGYSAKPESHQWKKIRQ